MTPPLFEPRLLLALGLLAGFFMVNSVADFRRHGAAAVKWREYVGLFVIGAAGAAFGAGNDFLTSAISPEYFAFGKGLPLDGLFRVRCVALGGQAGFVAAFVAGAILLYANRPKCGRTPVTFRRLCGLGAMTALVAATGGFVAGSIPTRFSPLHLTAEVAVDFTPEAAARFETVWRIHLGVYLGLSVGLAGSVVDVTRKRRTTRTPAR